MSFARFKRATPAITRRGDRRGLTLIELVLAIGLFSLLMIAVFRLLEGSLSLFRVSESRRDLLEQSTTVSELLARDLRALEGGVSGDLLLEQGRFDINGDGAEDARGMRLRLVRQVTPVERARLLTEQAVRATGQLPPPPDPDTPFEPGASALSEVCWAVLPEGKGAEERSALSVWRGERLLDDPTTKSFFEDGFFRRDGRWPSGALEEVSAGCLLLDLQLAGPTSVVRDGWELGDGLRHVATSWDAWAKGRPDLQAHAWNVAHPGLPTVRDQPTFPRRARILTEFERPIDRRRRTKLSTVLLINETSMKVDEPERVPRQDDSFVLIDAEWIAVRSIAGGTVSVQRGMRGTQPAQHEVGAILHHGLQMAREVPLPVYREDWDLR